jgi:hypothetical protein
MTNDMIETWTKVLSNVIAACVPLAIREQVLTRLLEKEQKRRTEPLILTSTAFTAQLDLGDSCAIEKASSVMIQVLTRNITNNHSPEDAARILFHDHYGRGTGSVWLPDYLDGLPGLTVNREHCIALANTADLHCEKNTTADMGPTFAIPDLRALEFDDAVEAAVTWFNTNYEDPAEHTPYCSAEGGYQYIWGGPCDAAEELYDAFGAAISDEIVEAAVKIIELDGCEWVPAQSRMLLEYDDET